MPGEPMLIDDYDAALFDLDGVIYLGPDPVPGAPAAMDRLRKHGVRLGFVTNNAARPPQVVVDQLRSFGIDVDVTDVVTSAQAGARVLADRYGAGARVLTVGAEGLRQAVTELGLVPVTSAEDHPVAVIQGYSPNLTWELITEAALAIQRGADWLATNTDPTRPTDRGLEPGNGAAVAAVRAAVEIEPEVAGKPYRPLMEETVRRLAADRPIFVGDRLDTDIAGAGNLGIASMLVLTGAHGPAQLLTATGIERPTHLGRDVADLLVPPRTEIAGEGRCAVAGIEAYVDAGDHDRIALSREPADDQVVDAIWAATRLAWRYADAGRALDGTELAAKLSERLRN